jgi:hypothetical protein
LQSSDGIVCHVECDIVAYDFSRRTPALSKVASSLRALAPKRHKCVFVAMLFVRATEFAILGVYGIMDKFPIGVVMNKGLTIRTAQQHGQKYVPRLLELAQKGEFDLSFMATNRYSLEDSPADTMSSKTNRTGVYVP